MKEKLNINNKKKDSVKGECNKYKQKIIKINKI